MIKGIQSQQEIGWIDYLGGSRYLHHHIHGLRTSSTSSRSNFCVLSALAICVYGAVFGLGKCHFPTPKKSAMFPQMPGSPSWAAGYFANLPNPQMAQTFFTHRFLPQFISYIALPDFG